MRFKSKNESGIDSQSGKNTGVGSHSFLQGILPTQSSNLGLPHCRQILYCLSCQGSPQPLLKKCKFKTKQNKNLVGGNLIILIYIKMEMFSDQLSTSKNLSYRYMCICAQHFLARIFIVALFVVRRMWQQAKCSHGNH